MKNQDFEESIPSVKLPTDIQVICHCETVLSTQRKDHHDRDSSNPTSVPESLHTSLASQARETLPFVLDETLILIGTVVNVVWYKEESSTQLAAFSQEDPLSICLSRPLW